MAQITLDNDTTKLLADTLMARCSNAKLTVYAGKRPETTTDSPATTNSKSLRVITFNAPAGVTSGSTVTFNGFTTANDKAGPDAGSTLDGPDYTKRWGRIAVGSNVIFDIDLPSTAGVMSESLIISYILPNGGNVRTNDPPPVYIYVAGTNGVYPVNVSSVDSPVVEKPYKNASVTEYWNIVMHNGAIYAACGDSGIETLNVKGSSITKIDLLGTAGAELFYGKKLVRSGNMILTAAKQRGLLIFSIGGDKKLSYFNGYTPEKIRDASGAEHQPAFNDMAIKGDYAYLCAGNDGLYVVNISRLTSGQNSAVSINNGVTRLVSVAGFVNNAFVSGDRLYVSVDEIGIYVYDISNPSNITLVSDTPGGGYGPYNSLLFKSGAVFIAKGTQGVFTYAIDPASGLLQDPKRFQLSLNFSTDTLGPALAKDIVQSNETIYVATDQGLFVIDAMNSGNLSLVGKGVALISGAISVTF